MKSKKYFMLVLLGSILAKTVTGCGTASNLQNRNMTQTEIDSIEEVSLDACAADSGEADMEGDFFAESFRIYEQFGLTYDEDKNELYYNGKTVRWFEDYYLLADGAQAGRDFFNEKGVVDVYAIRDQSSLVQNDDGSFDPSGKLAGLEEFSEEEFAARNPDAIKNSAPVTAVAGGPVSKRELQKMAEEYGVFGVTYDAKEEQWYFKGEKIRYFRDILTSNGESLSGGNFHGTMRTFGDEDGVVDIYTIRDYENVNALGYGTLLSIERYSQEEFDSRTSAGQESGRESSAVEGPGNVDMTVYEPYGLTFDKQKDCYTYNGNIVRYFNDWQSGASFTNFSAGTVDIEAKYDDNQNLIGIIECSQEMYDFHSNKMQNTMALPNDGVQEVKAR